MESVEPGFVHKSGNIQNRNVETTVITDHESLRTLLSAKRPTGVLAKYIMFLAQYSFKIKYRKGSNNEADTLSRHPVDEPNVTVEELVDDIFPDIAFPFKNYRQCRQQHLPAIHPGGWNSVF